MLLEEALRGSCRLGNIMGHFLGCVSFFFNNLRLLSLLGRTARRRKDLSQALLTNICLLGGSVNFRVRGARRTNGRRVVYTICSPEGKGGLSPSLVKGLILHLEAVVPTHLRDLNPKGLFGLRHSCLIPVLLNLVLGLLSLLQFLRQDFYMSFGCGELILGSIELLALNLRLLLCPIKSSLGSFLVSFSFS